MGCFEAAIHRLFDSCAISVNPDVRILNEVYEVTLLARLSASRMVVRALPVNHRDQRFDQDLYRPIYELLRWHFCWVVLANMGGAGGPVFEGDLLRGLMVGELSCLAFWRRIDDCL